MEIFKGTRRNPCCTGKIRYSKISTDDMNNSKDAGNCNSIKRFNENGIFNNLIIMALLININDC